MTITKKQLERMNAIYDEAIGRYLDKMDVDVLDWMEEEAKREYQKLHFLMDSQCVVCGNPEVMYICPDKECEDHGEASESADECSCGKKMVVDKDYHNEC